MASAIFQPSKCMLCCVLLLLLQDTDTPSLGHMAHHLINVPKWDAWKHLPQVRMTQP
jgi:hypothetical protein